MYSGNGVSPESEGTLLGLLPADDPAASDADSQMVRASPTTIVMKRSVSPGGRINCLSIEITGGIDSSESDDIVATGTTMLRAQEALVDEFLRSHQKPVNGSAGQAGPSYGMVSAKMLYVGSFTSSNGQRLFIAFQAGNRGLKLFGTADELATAIADAGREIDASDIVKGMRLDLPCCVATKPSPDGRYTDIDQVFPEAGPDVAA